MLRLRMPFLEALTLFTVERHNSNLPPRLADAKQLSISDQ